LNECHGEIDQQAQWVDDGISDMNGDCHYSIVEIKEVNPDHTEMLTQHLLNNIDLPSSTEPAVIDVTFDGG
jgi:hypothetical protein